METKVRRLADQTTRPRNRTLEVADLDNVNTMMRNSKLADKMSRAVNSAAKLVKMVVHRVKVVLANPTVVRFRLTPEHAAARAVVPGAALVDVEADPVVAPVAEAADGRRRLISNFKSNQQLAC